MKTSRLDSLRQRFTAYDLCFLGGMIFIVLLYLYRLPLGAGGNDEAFYLTIPQRLVQGDGLFTDEWHGSQLYTFYVTPILALRNLFFPTNEGIIVQYRYIYLFFHALVAVGIYLRLRKRYRHLGCVLGPLLLFLFTPYSIATICYNTLGLDLVSLTLCLLLTAQSRRVYFFAGLAFAGAVLCVPHLVLAYAVFSGATLVFAWRKRRREPVVDWLCFTAGCALLAAALLAFVLWRSSLALLPDSFSWIFSDPEHPPLSLEQKWTLVAEKFASFYGFPLFLELMMIPAAVMDEKRFQRRRAYLLLAGACTLWMLAKCVPNAHIGTFNHILFALTPFGLVAFILTKDRDWRAFFFLYLGGLAYALCAHLASNQHIYAISSALTVSGIASVLFSFHLLAEWRAVAPLPPRKERTITAWVTAVVVVVMVCQFWLMADTKINHKFKDTAPNDTLTVTLTEGPYAGARVTPQGAKDYNNKLALYHRAMDPLPSGRALFAAHTVWYHLVDRRFSNGAFSAWLSGTKNNTVDRLRAYYDLDSGHIPDYIFMPDDAQWDREYFTRQIIDPFGFTLTAQVDGASVYTRQAPPADPLR